MTPIYVVVSTQLLVASSDLNTNYNSTMVQSYSSILEKNNCVGTGSVSFVYNVSSTIAVKTVRGQHSKKEEEEEEHPFHREIHFYECLNKRQDRRCPDILECFLALPDNLFLSYCPLNDIHYRFSER